MNNRTKIVRDTLMYIWNTSWPDFCMDIFEVDLETAPNHKKLWLERYKLAYNENPASLFAILDYDNMNKISDAAKLKYGDIDGI
jgi:hypothetical protein